MKINGNMIDITKEVRRAERKARFRARVNAVKEWANGNKEIIIAAVPVAIGTVGGAIRILGRRNNLKREERNKDLRCYDASLGHYWELRRKLSNEEWVAIDRRKKNGERLADILDELRVLK